jgi:hypothetical protein
MVAVALLLLAYLGNPRGIFFYANAMLLLFLVSFNVETRIVLDVLSDELVLRLFNVVS